MRYRLLLVSIILGLAALACSISAPSVTGTPLPHTPTASAQGPGDCLYVEASNPLPDSQTALRMALEADGVMVQAVSVYGEGEDYICEDGSSRFSVRAAFATLTLPVDDVNAKEQLGSKAAEVLKVLEGLPYEQLPNWRSGQVRLILTSAGRQVELKFLGSFGADLFDQGLRGAALWEALRHQPCQAYATYVKLDEISAKVQAEMIAAGLTNVSAYVQGYGTHCIDPVTQAVESTSILYTNYQIDISGASGRAAQGDMAAQALAVIVKFPPETLPGDEPGDVTVAFAPEGVSYTVSFATALKSVNQGLKGEELFALLETGY